MSDAPRDLYTEHGPLPRGNKNTATIKLQVLVALDKLGGVDWLVRQGADNPVAFISLLAKIMPTQITGPDDQDLNIKVSFERRDPDSSKA